MRCKREEISCGGDSVKSSMCLIKQVVVVKQRESLSVL